MKNLPGYLGTTIAIAMVALITSLPGTAPAVVLDSDNKLTVTLSDGTQVEQVPWR